MSRRRFNRSERIALYLSAEGHCVACGRPLSAGWHADHVRPYARGGETDLMNGQALCPDCNLAKGALPGMDVSEFVPRPHQRQVIGSIERKLALGHRVEVDDIFPGMGKTKGYLAGIHLLAREGAIDAALVLVPRVNLAVQVEQDWASLRFLLGDPLLGTIVHRDNEPPLFRDGQFGYVGTYASLVANPAVHLDALRGRRFAVVFDEAQQLGYGEEGGGTRGAEDGLEVMSAAAFTFVETGWHLRADNRPLLGARYGKPDKKGERPLLYDVRAGYQAGVEWGFLRRFDFTLANGEGTYEYLTGETEDLNLAEMKSGIRKITEFPDYWQPMVDMAVEQVRQSQSIDARFCGLIGATRQQHARDIMEYLSRRHRGVKAVLAVSDEREARDHLRRFRRGGDDLLVTVGMAYIGYDHPPITVIAMLNDFREWGWMAQFLGRGLRAMPDVPFDDQCLRGICPPDPRARRFFEWMRNESALGLKAREKHDPPPPPPPPRLGKTTEARLTDVWGMSDDSAGDTSPEEFKRIDEMARAAGLGAAARGRLKIFISNWEASPRPSAPAADGRKRPPSARQGLTEREREKEKRVWLNKELVKLDLWLMDGGVPGVDHGWAATQMKKAFNGIGIPSCSMKDLGEREAWLYEELRPAVEAMVRRYASARAD